MFNNFIGVGNLTKEPEIRFLPNGDKVGSISLAFNKKFKNKNGELMEKVCFLDGKVFGKMVETIEAYLHKGDRVLVQGELVEESWFSPDGAKKHKHILSISTIKFLNPKNTQEEQEQQEPEINIDNEELPPF